MKESAPTSTISQSANTLLAPKQSAIQPAATTSTQKDVDGGQVQVKDRRIAGAIDIFLMNLGLVLPNVMIEWHYALDEGIGSFLISLGICSVAYLCLALCIAELAGIVAFSGGSYGYSRCALSPFIGYIVGICDLLQSVMFTALCVHYVSKALSMSVSGHDYLKYLPCWWIALYALILAIALPGGRCFWNSMSGFTAMTVVMLLIYCLGNASRMDFHHYAVEPVEPFEKDPQTFFMHMIYPTVCFVGIDFITLYSDEAKDPQRDLPRAIIGTQLVNMVFVFWVIMTCVSIYPGVSPELYNEEVIFPTHFGFEDIFHVSNSIANFMIAPTKFASASGLLFAAGRQMHSMSKSGLLPQCLSITYGANQVPIAAMLTTSVIGLIVLFPLWLTDPQGDDIYELSLLGACVVYLSMFWCYLLFKVHYGSMDRTFVNPLGSASAIFGIIYFGTLIISILFVQLDFHALIGFVPLILLSIVYYYKVVEARQFFSKEEQQKFMKAYILNANRKKKKGLSPFMKKVRWVYETLGLSVCCGAWTMGLPGGRENSSVASSSNKSNGSKTSSKVSASKLSVSFNSKSISETRFSKPFESESGSVHDDKVQLAALEEGDVSVTNKASIGGLQSKKGSFRIVPVVSRPIETDVSKDEEEQQKQDDLNFHANHEHEKQDDVAIVPLTSSALAAVSKVHDNEGQPAVTWSGKLLTEQESRQFFEIINQRPPSHHGSAAASVHSNHDAERDAEADLVARMPDKFSVAPHVRSKEELIAAALSLEF